MKKLLLLAGLCMTFGVEAKQSSQSVEAIKQKIIKESIESYPVIAHVLIIQRVMVVVVVSVVLITERVDMRHFVIRRI